MQDAIWDRRLSQPLLIALFTVCLLIGPLNIIEILLKGWRSGYMLPFLFITSFWAYFNYRSATPVEQWTRRTLAFRIGQALIILLAARLLAWAGTALPTSDEIAGWLVDPARFFDAPWVLSSLLALSAWAWSGTAAALFQELRLHSSELAPRSHGYRYNVWTDEAPRPIDRTGLVQNFSQRFIYGGMLLAICAALLRIDFQPPGGGLIGIRQSGLPLSILIALVGYTLTGLALISAGRFGILRARWQLGEIPVKDAVNQRWVRYVLAFMGLIAIIAALLPLGNTWGLATLLYYVLGILTMLIQYIIAGIFLLIALIMSALGMHQGSEGTATPQPIPPPMLPAATQGSGLPPWLGGAVFWLFAVLVAIYTLLTVLRNRNLIGQEWSPATLLVHILNWWHNLRRQANRLRRQMRITAPALANPLNLSTRPPAAPRGDDPRSRVRFFYHNMLDRAAEVGTPRHPAQTPFEYEQTLRQKFPDADPDASQLTEAFVEARYNSRPIADQEAHQAETWWERLRMLLAHKRA